jgi:hypothetical protein
MNTTLFESYTNPAQARLLVKPTTEAYTDLDLANARILELERFVRNEFESRKALMRATTASDQWHNTETARYRKIASDATDHRVQQHRDYVLHKQAIAQITQALLDNNPATEPIDQDMLESVKRSLEHEKSLDMEGYHKRQRASAMEDMLHYLQFTCEDAGLPVEPDAPAAALKK